MNINDFLNSSGRVSSTKTTEKYFTKNLPDEFISIKNHSRKINLSVKTFSEEIYHYLNKLESPVKCKNCGDKKTKFTGLLNGYIDYCSSKCSNNSKAVKDLKEKSYMEKYGVKNPSHSPDVILKIKETFDSKYGGNPFSIFNERIKETNVNKYGTPHPLARGSNLREKMSKDFFLRFIEKYKDLEITDYESIKGGTCKVKCKVCSGEFTITKWNLHQRVENSEMENPCTICNPIGQSTESEMENKVRRILDEVGVEYVEGDRSILDGKEIDFYLPKHRIGIEVDGLFWHSERFKAKNYHLDKTKKAEEKGIRLVHIFEDEINNKPDLVESRIKSIIGVYERKIFARKCEIREISRKESGEFLNRNHMQGNTGAKIRLGLFFEGNLVSVMTFGNLRISLGSKSKENQWELIRFANKMGYVIIGGASKLLNYFIKRIGPKKIISYCDRRWSNGDFYEKIGFSRISETSPNYWYVKNSKRESRFKFRKDRLISDGYDKAKSESLIMTERGFLKIHDCGSFKFEINFK